MEVQKAFASTVGIEEIELFRSDPPIKTPGSLSQAFKELMSYPAAFQVYKELMSCSAVTQPCCAGGLIHPNRPEGLHAVCQRCDSTRTKPCFKGSYYDSSSHHCDSCNHCCPDRSPISATEYNHVRPDSYQPTHSFSQTVRGQSSPAQDVSIHIPDVDDTVEPNRMLQPCGSTDDKWAKLAEISNRPEDLHAVCPRCDSTRTKPCFKGSYCDSSSHHCESCHHCWGATHSFSQTVGGQSSPAQHVSVDIPDVDDTVEPNRILQPCGSTDDKWAKLAEIVLGISAAAGYTTSSSFPKAANAAGFLATLTAISLCHRTGRAATRILIKFGAVACAAGTLAAIGNDLPEEYKWIAAVAFLIPATAVAFA